MKKTVWTLLLVALLTVMLAIPATAEDAVVHCMCGETTTLDAVCDSCKTAAVQWQPWTDAATLPVTGNYYLMTDVNLTSDRPLGSGRVLNLDLNGYTITQTATNKPVFYPNGNAQLSITDTSAACTGKIVSRATAEKNGGILELANTAVLNIYGGTLDASGATVTRGAAIYLAKGTTANIYGGTVIGGTANYGDAVYVAEGSTFTVSGSARVGEVYSGATGKNCRYGCVCGDPNGTGTPCAEGGHTSVQWQAWSTANSLEPTGNYYLTTDVNLTADRTMGDNRDLKLDLNGHTITQTAANKSVFYLYSNAKLTITDTTGTGKVVPNATTDRGGIVRLDQSAVLNIYGGTLDASASTANYGSAIELNNTTAVNMYGGTIIGGKAINGGTVRMNGCTFNMTGGTITGGTAVGGTDATANGYGGNFYVSGSAVLNITGGTVSDGVAQMTEGAEATTDKDVLGGNIGIFSANAKVTIGGDAKVTGGEADRGGNIYIQTGSLTIKDTATVTGGTSRGNAYGKQGDCVLINNSMNGTNGTVSLAGAPTVEKLQIASASVMLNITGLTKDANIGVVTYAATGVFTTAADSADVAQAFHSTRSGSVVVANADKTLSTVAARIRCMCGETTTLDATCESCETKAVTWQPWSKANALDPTGNYYLTTDVNLTADRTMGDNRDLKLDLNGHTITQTAAGKPVFYMYSNAQLTITDTTGTGKVVPHATTDRGGIVRLDQSAVLNIYGGTLDASASTANYGSAIELNNTTAVNMYGGTIIGGKAINGGTVRMTGGTFNMTGGTITGGTAVGGTDATGNGYGGNFFVSGSAVLNITGGTVSNGVAQMTEGATATTDKDVLGGNIAIYAANAKVTIGGDAKVTGGEADRGGNIYIQTGSLTIKDTATVTGGTSRGNAYGKQGDCVLINNSMNGTNGTVSLAGAPTVEKLQIASASVMLNITGLTKDANIGVITNSATGVFTTAADSADVAQAFHSTRSGYKARALSDKTLEMVAESLRTYCMCGETTVIDVICENCKQAAVDWQPWTDAANLPRTGNHYLTGNMDITAEWSLGKGRVLNLDLNGYAITQTKAETRVFYLYCNPVLTIIDSSEAGTGKVVSHADLIPESGNYYGGIIALDIYEGLAPTVNLYSGTLDASASTAAFGTAIRMVAGTINMYGGKIIGGTAISPTSGGAVASLTGGTFNMMDGEIIGGKAANGGAIFIRSGAVFNMSGGSISGGEATGSNGGNICAASGAKVEILSGKVYGGSTAAENMEQRGGNIYFSGADTVVTIGGNAEVYGGSAGWGGNIGYHNDGTLVIEGSAKIYDGTANYVYEGAVRGGDIYGNTANVITLSGSPEIGDLMVTGGKMTVNALDGAKIGISATYNYEFANSTFTETEAACFTATQDGKSIYLADGHLLLVNDGTEVTVGDQVVPFDAAVYLVGKDGYIKLHQDIAANITAQKNVAIDLNGHTISGKFYIVDGAVVSLFDNTTSDFSVVPETYGKITGELKLYHGSSLARSMNTPAGFGHNYKYLTILEDDGCYSAHRIYLTVKSVVLTPYNTGISFRTVFKCNSVVAQYVEGYGVRLADGDHYYEGEIVFGGDMNLKTTNIGNILDVNDLVAANAEQQITISALIKLNDGLGGEFVSAEVSRSLIDVITTANANFDSLSGAQQRALRSMYQTFLPVMSTWSDDIIGNIKETV